MRLGVCYYPEHWPEAMWKDDAARMKALGIDQVRIAEFAWSRIEPAPGEFDWGWLDRAIDTLAAEGLKVVMCTPTATPPKWLIDRHPDILPVGADGQTRGFGSRRHYDFSSPTYFEASKAICEAIASRYGQHPAVAYWQTDNEYGCHQTVVSYSPAALTRFRAWLKARYGNIDTLNRAWGTVFWSMEYRSFEEIDAPIGTVTEAHPSHRLDYRRFASDEVKRYNHMQVEIIRKHSPGRPIAHNFMQLFTEFDHYKVADDLDVASWDSYPLGALEEQWYEPEIKAKFLRTGHPDFASFNHDLYRGMSKLPFWVMEQQPGPVNWAKWNPAPLPGMVRLWSWEAFAHGAGCVSYFRWRQAPFAQEQMHAGLHTPDNRLDIGGGEAQRVAQEIRAVVAADADAAGAVRTPVALVFDYEAKWLFEVQPQGLDFHSRVSPSNTTRRCVRSGSTSTSFQRTRRSTVTSSSSCRRCPSSPTISSGGSKPRARISSSGRAPDRRPPICKSPPTCRRGRSHRCFPRASGGSNRCGPTSPRASPSAAACPRAMRGTGAICSMSAPMATVRPLKFAPPSPMVIPPM